MQTFTDGKFTFRVPEGHPQAGQKIDKTFDYPQCDNDAEARRAMTHDTEGKPRPKPWSLRKIINDILKENARNNAYQAAILPYRQSDVPTEDIVERMVRDAIRLGAPENEARERIAALLHAA